MDDYGYVEEVTRSSPTTTVIIILPPGLLVHTTLVIQAIIGCPMSY